MGRIWGDLGGPQNFGGAAGPGEQETCQVATRGPRCSAPAPSQLEELSWLACGARPQMLQMLSRLACGDLGWGGSGWGFERRVGLPRTPLLAPALRNWSWVSPQLPKGPPPRLLSPHIWPSSAPRLLSMAPQETQPSDSLPFSLFLPLDPPFPFPSH